MGLSAGTLSSASGMGVSHVISIKRDSWGKIRGPNHGCRVFWATPLSLLNMVHGKVPGCTWYIQRTTTLPSFYLPSPPTHTFCLSVSLHLDSRLWPSHATGGQSPGGPAEAGKIPCPLLQLLGSQPPPAKGLSLSKLQGWKTVVNPPN